VSFAGSGTLSCRTSKVIAMATTPSDKVSRRSTPGSSSRKPVSVDMDTYLPNSTAADQRPCQDRQVTRQRACRAERYRVRRGHETAVRPARLVDDLRPDRDSNAGPTANPKIGELPARGSVRRSRAQGQVLRSVLSSARNVPLRGTSFRLGGRLTCADMLPSAW
jgi:hypothetical protein